MTTPVRVRLRLSRRQWKEAISTRPPISRLNLSGEPLADRFSKAAELAQM